MVVLCVAKPEVHLQNFCVSLLRMLLNLSSFKLKSFQLSPVDLQAPYMMHQAWSLKVFARWHVAVE
eukprot:1162032-Pelagomonas_calceolata.AAC.2